MTETKQPRDSAQIRRGRAKEKGNLSISHWLGDLHTHTKEGDEESPEKTAETRSGSNCGEVALRVLTRFHIDRMKNEYLAVTDHSGDANPEAALEGITNWFVSWFLSDQKWLMKNLGKPKDELTPEDREVITQKATALAEKIANYNDTRLKTNLAKIDQQRNDLKESNSPFELIAGIEANLLPDGNFDSKMVTEGKFDLVIASIHPDLNPQEFADIMASPQLYTDLVIQGIEQPKTNIMGHIGFDTTSPEFVEQLDWDKIAQAAIANNVAIEVNIRPLMKYIYKEMMDYDKYPANQTSYRQSFKEKLPELIPLLSSKTIRNKLKPYLDQGLRIAINADEHKLPFTETTNLELDENNNEDKAYRFWRCLKLAENQFSNWFNDMEIDQKHIINTYPIDQLKEFLTKA